MQKATNFYIAVALLQFFGEVFFAEEEKSPTNEEGLIEHDHDETDAGELLDLCLAIIRALSRRFR